MVTNVAAKVNLTVLRQVGFCAYVKLLELNGAAVSIRELASPWKKTRQDPCGLPNSLPSDEL